MIRLRRNPTASAAAVVEADESWFDSAFWGASFALLLVVLLLFGVGYVGYASLERSSAPAAAPAAKTATR